MATTEADGDFPISSRWASQGNSYRFPNIRQHTPRQQIFYASNDSTISDVMRTWMFATETPDPSSSTRLSMMGLGL